MRRTLEELEADFIRVTDKYLIQVNELDFCVRKRGNNNYRAYYGSLEHALEHIRAEIIREGLTNEARTLEDVITVITRDRENFEKFVKTALENIGYTNQKFFEAKNGIKYS